VASNNNFNGLKFAVVVVAVVGLSGVIGYFLAGNGRSTPQVNAPIQVAQTTSDAPAASAGDGSADDTLAARGGDFTAPGAPKIEVREVKPRLQDDTRPPKPAPKDQDSEASQEDAPPPPPDITAPTDDAAIAGQPSPVTGQTTTPANTDPDYESVGNGADTAATGNGDDDSQSGGGGPYRVQVGSFAYARNAKALADALHSRGYTTSTVIAKDGDKTTYHVQAGAFQTQKAAQKASEDLQKAGFPACIQQGQ
jgi:cell division septation protein DedD